MHPFDKCIALQNSWGAGWGENGFLRLAMGTDQANPNGMCGILQRPIVPYFSKIHSEMKSIYDLLFVEDM